MCVCVCARTRVCVCLRVICARMGMFVRVCAVVKLFLEILRQNSFDNTLSAFQRKHKMTVQIRAYCGPYLANAFLTQFKQQAARRHSKLTM